MCLGVNRLAVPDNGAQTCPISGHDRLRMHGQRPITLCWPSLDDVPCETRYGRRDAEMAHEILALVGWRRRKGQERTTVMLDVAGNLDEGDDGVIGPGWVVRPGMR